MPGITYRYHDVLHAVDHIGHWKTGLFRRQFQLVQNFTTELVVRAEHPATAGLPTVEARPFTGKQQAARDQQATTVTMPGTRQVHTTQTRVVADFFRRVG